MKITKLDVYILRAPDTGRPHWVSHFIVPRANEILVRMQTDEGVEGIGIATSYTPIEAAIKAFKSGIAEFVIGADPLAVGLLFTRLRVSSEGIDVLGFLSQAELTEELLAAKTLVAPSLGGESFGMVLTRAFACATPVVASDIAGYRGVMEPEAGLLVPPGEPAALADAIVSLLADEPRRMELGRAARTIAQERYSWDRIARQLAEVYEDLAGSRNAVAA